MAKTTKKRKQNEEKRKASVLKAAGIVALIVLLLAVFVLGGFVLAKEKGRKEMLGKGDGQVPLTAPALEEQEVILEDDGEIVIYNGQRYRYNENITSVLCMGIDREGWNEEENVIGTSGQADMLMLAILDTQSGRVKLWNISRDSMVDVDIYDTEGNFAKTESMQLCLAFAYGDGKEGSCQNTLRSVSRLLYGMPVQSYAALDMDAIVPLNDAVGGVEVTIHEEDILPGGFVPGTTMLLQGEEARAYVQSRRTELPDEALDSNNNRMDRQKQYMMNFIQKALQQTKQDISTPVKLFQVAMEGDNMVTNLTVSRVSYLASIFKNVNFSEESFQTVPGEVVKGESYAEYHVDDQALYEMILDTFYLKED